MHVRNITALVDGVRTLGPRLAEWLGGARPETVLWLVLRPAIAGVRLDLELQGPEIGSLDRLLDSCDRLEVSTRRAPSIAGELMFARVTEGPCIPSGELPEVARLLLVQPGPCEVRLRLQRSERLAQAGSEMLSHVEGLLRGIEQRTDRTVQTRLPEDLLELRRAGLALRTQELWRRALSEGAVEVTLGVRGPAGRDLLHAAGRALLGARGMSWVPAAEGAERPVRVPLAVAGRMLDVDATELPGLPRLRGRLRRVGGRLDSAGMLGNAATRRGMRPVGLSGEDLGRHLYVSGKTGVGKSTLLRSLVLDLAERGEGLALIDPHGDLADSLLERLPAERVVLFDPRLPSCPGLDPLRNDGTLAGQERGVEELASILWKLFPPEYMGASFDRHSRALLLPLVHANEPLESVLRMDWDEDFRERMLGGLHTHRSIHQEVRTFWEKEYAAWGAQDRAEMRNFTVAKYEILLRSPALRLACGRRSSQLDLAACAQQGQVVIARLPQGELGPVTAWFLGMLLMSRLQAAIFGRASMSPADRRPFTVVIDEFQNFVGAGGFGYARNERTLGPLLSEGRKFGLRLVLANQYMAQLDASTQAAILGNVGSLVSFRCGGPDAAVLAEELGVPAAELVDLPLFQAVARLLQDGRKSLPFSLVTVPS